MFVFCKNGLCILEDSEGTLHYFDPANSLKDVASYVWQKESLSGYRGTPNPFEGADRPVEYVDPETNPVHRLRSLSSILDDSFYTEKY